MASRRGLRVTTRSRVSTPLPGEWMEHLWSPAGATGGTRWQMGRARKPLKQADPQPVATHGTGFGAHGKEGVDGSSPSEGFNDSLKWVFVTRVARAGDKGRTSRHDHGQPRNIFQASRARPTA